MIDHNGVGQSHDHRLRLFGRMWRGELWEDGCIIKTENELLTHLDKLHTTDLGAVRIRRNLSLKVEDVVGWCKDKAASTEAVIVRKGKNWYVDVDGCTITINAHSYTIITAHLNA